MRTEAVAAPGSSGRVLDQRPVGLASEEAERRLRQRPPLKPAAGSRSYASIVRGNVLTLFNAILAAFGALTLLFGDWRDALFLGVLVANSTIGIGQEIRAKRALDRLAALVAPQASALRDGKLRSLPVERLVVGDVIRLQPGDQLVADGRLLESIGLRLDESILTGESRAVARGAGERVRSGSFAVEGSALYEVEGVGADSYAERVASEAKVYRRLRSPLERAFDRLLLLLVAAMLPLAMILGYSLWQRQAPIPEAVTTSAAAVVSLIPEGLIVLMSLTFAVAALRMARRGALAQRLNAVESLASVDVICFDKTGTLTEPGLRVAELIAAPGSEPGQQERLLARFAASSSTANATLEAIATAYPGSPEPVSAEVPFSSRLRWSAVEFADGAFVLGAPELFALNGSQEAVGRHQRGGRRVLAFGVADELPGDTDAAPEARLLALLILSEPLRTDARTTIEYFREEGIEMKIFSGDAPSTVAAIAADAGLELKGPPLDGSQLPEAEGELRELARDVTVVGRISPEGKRDLVRALRDDGRYVAMVGDGVNDVPALKAARLAIAQGSGVQMAKQVADVVLVSGDFSAVPQMMRKGRQILRNLQRVAKLYVSKSAFAAFLILTVGTTATAYPLLPRHFSLVAALTIGIPTFFLALAPSRGRWQLGDFLGALGRFAVPAGVATGIGVVASYQFSLNALDLPLVESRTVAATTLLLVGLYLILALEGTRQRRGEFVLGLCALLGSSYVLAIALPLTREFFELAAPSAEAAATAVFGAAVAIVALLASGFPEDRDAARNAASGD